MTGRHKNEEFDIISQAQKVVEEYEEKYFKCLGEAFVRKRKAKTKRNVFLILVLVAGMFFALILKMFFI